MNTLACNDIEMAGGTYSLNTTLSWVLTYFFELKTKFKENNGKVCTTTWFFLYSYASVNAFEWATYFYAATQYCVSNKPKVDPRPDLLSSETYSKDITQLTTYLYITSSVVFSS